MITRDNLEKLPDHTEQIEDIASKSNVQKVIPQHMGGGEKGRFCISFFVVLENSVNVFSLTEGDAGLGFEKVYSFPLQSDVDLSGEVWDAYAVFQWEDRVEADKAKKTSNLYARQFTLGEKVPESRIPDIVENASWGEEKEKLPECDCHQQPTTEKQIDQLGLTVGVCSNCQRAYRLQLPQGSASTYESSLDFEWLDGPFAPGTTPYADENLRFYEASPGSETVGADATLHGLSRESHAEFPNFGFYPGEGSSGLLIGDQEIERVVGYLMWNRPREVERPCLQQLYVRPNYRGEGYGKSLLTTWFEEFISERRYYAIEVSDRGEQFLRQAGHLSDSKDCPAIPARPVGAWDTEGSEISDRAVTERMRKQGY